MLRPRQLLVKKSAISCFELQFLARAKPSLALLSSNRREPIPLFDIEIQFYSESRNSSTPLLILWGQSRRSTLKYCSLSLKILVEEVPCSQPGHSRAPLFLLLSNLDCLWASWLSRRIQGSFAVQWTAACLRLLSAVRLLQLWFDLEIDISPTSWPIQPTTIWPHPLSSVSYPSFPCSPVDYSWPASPSPSLCPSPSWPVSLNSIYAGSATLQAWV